MICAGDKASKMNGVASDGEFWISKIQNTIQRLDGDTRHLKVLAVNEGDSTVTQKARDMILRLQKVCRSIVNDIQP